MMMLFLMLIGRGFHLRRTRLWKQLKVTLERDLGYLKEPLLEFEGATEKRNSHQEISMFVLQDFKTF